MLYNKSSSANRSSNYLSIRNLVSDDITLTSMSCNYIPDDCSTSTSLNVHNRTVTYFVCPTTTIEPLPPGVTTTTICPHSKCHSPGGGKWRW